MIFAPGYRFPGSLERLSDVDTVSPEVLARLGLAVATLEYRKTGLAVKEGVQDVEELLAFFATDPQGCGYGRPRAAFLIGASEGGLIAALLAEREAARPGPTLDGVLAACGPIGDFGRQLQHIADFRMVFDALVPGVIPGSAIAVPQEVIAAWESDYRPRIRALIAAQPARLEQLLRVTGAAWMPGDLATLEATVLLLLGYAAAESTMPSSRSAAIPSTMRPAATRDRETGRSTRKSMSRPSASAPIRRPSPSSRRTIRRAGASRSSQAAARACRC